MDWFKNEGAKPNWMSLAQERGYASWADWRIKECATPFDCRNAKWGYYEITDPAHVIENWQGGPFRTWIERHYDGKKSRTFSEIVTRPEISGHLGIRARMADYPVDIPIIAMEMIDGKIIVIEGMHRACALALMAKENGKAPEKLIFAIGRSDLDELPETVEDMAL